MELLPFLFGAPAPRTVRVDGQRFVAAGSNATLIMVGPNVVVKGPPYLPSVSGTTICNDHVDFFFEWTWRGHGDAFSR